MLASIDRGTRPQLYSANGSRYQSSHMTNNGFQSKAPMLSPTPKYTQNSCQKIPSRVSSSSLHKPHPIITLCPNLHFIPLLSHSSLSSLPSFLIQIISPNISNHKTTSSGQTNSLSLSAGILYATILGLLSTCSKPSAAVVVF